MEQPAISSDSASDYMDAEGDSEPNDYFHDSDQKEQEENLHSIIHEIREELGTRVPIMDAKDTARLPVQTMSALSLTSASSTSSDSTLQATTAAATNDEVDYLQDDNWRQQKKHIFILSDAGKPIYSLHGNENKLATLFGIIQALVSFVQHGQDAITSIHAKGLKFVFLLRNSLILVAVSRSNMSVQQLQLQLSDVYNQILSTLTYSTMSKQFANRKNFDLRHSLGGSERLIYNLLANDSSNKRISNNVFTFLTNSIRVLPLVPSVRANITSAIQSNCAKIQNLVFAVLIANNKLIALVRMKKYSIHPADLRLIFNLIESSQSFKTSENWTPICLPRFDMNGYLYAHISYLSDDCQACLLLLSVDRDVFFTLSEAKQNIVTKLRRSNCLEAINEEMHKGTRSKLNHNALGIPELRHFLYKPKASAQLLCSELQSPFYTLSEFEHLEAIYCDLFQRIHSNTRSLKLIYEVRELEVVLAWVTAGYEFYAVFGPLANRSTVIKHVDKLIRWIEKEYDVYFIRNHPTF